MIRDQVFRRPELPRELEIQVLDFMRMEWPDAFMTEERHRDRLWEDDDAMHFVRTVGDLLVSHVQVLSIRFDGTTPPLRIGGVASVLTYPQFRGEGHGSAVVLRATEHVRDARFDVGMLFCDDETRPFYERFGWRALPAGRVLVAGSQPEDVVMIAGDEHAVPDPLRLDWSW